MNQYYAIGKISNQPQFDFLYQQKRTSIAYFWLELSNNSKIEVVAYDDIADDIYRNFTKGDHILVEGRLTGNLKLKVEIIQINKL